MENFFGEKISIDIPKCKQQFCEILRMCFMEQLESFSFYCLNIFSHSYNKLIILMQVVLSCAEMRDV